MRCPYCDNVLVSGTPKRYETLDEHVSNPNGMPSVKPTFVCSNKDCILFGNLFLWDPFGDCYNSVSFETLEKVKKLCHNGKLEARGSEARKRNVEIYGGKSFYGPAFFNRKFKVEIHFFGDRDGNRRRIKSVKIRWLVKENYSWVYKTSNITMFLYAINNFNYHKKRYLENSPNFAIDRIKEDISPLKEYELKDKWRVLAKRWIQFRHKNFIKKFKIKQLLLSR